MKCNLECDYCVSGLHGGRDNSTKHPPLQECLDSLDFMFKYVDLYMATKPKGIGHVILNVYGGEALHHPDIIAILKAVREHYVPYQDRWHLTVTTTTNAIISKRILDQVIPLIDEFTVSYHTNNTNQQKQQFKDNLLSIQSAGRRLKCVVLMHADPELFADAQNHITWLNSHGIKHLPRQIDDADYVLNLNYQSKEVHWFKDLYKTKTKGDAQHLPEFTQQADGSVNMTKIGRACCGGRQVCANQNYKQKEFYINNRFTNWYCSVNHFFVFIKQLTKEVYVNKDCKMNFDGNVGPIGTIDKADILLEQTRLQLESDSAPIIKCAKSLCYCGLCAPKAQDLDTYKIIMKKYQKVLT